MKAILPHTTLSHYRIVSRIGAGGMGEVYLAEDERLRRRVALKVLPESIAQDTERLRRFEQEAQAASALNHPNIITVYDIGECEAGRFIVMELVAGRTLRAVIGDNNALDNLLSLGAQMAKALSAAHAAGITHRDIKPDNIMVRDDGYVKVLDFGLARLRPTTESDSDAVTMAQQTTPGTVMGTVAYMSPEQARGETVSHPSDVFALGIVLYELATGRHPFQAETLVGYLHAITLQEPAPPQQWQPNLPAAVNELLLRMLAKDAKQRPTANEVAQALQAMERGGDVARVQSVESETMILPSVSSGVALTDEGFWVAVLPFKWRGANAELEALAEGLSEDIVTGLSRFSYLRVIARGSTLRYTNESGDVRAIGKELGARYVMEGSLRQAGSMLRVAVQLVDASTGAHLWAETYDRQFRTEDIFALQDELVPRIVSTVADAYGALVHSMSESLRGRSAGQYSAHEAMLRAFGYGERATPDEHREVREILEAVVAAAPDHSECLAMLSVIYCSEYVHGYNVRPDPLSRALAAAQRAVAAAPTNQHAHYSLAYVLFFQKDFLAFRQAAERALALNRMDASTMALLGTLTAFAGDWEDGLHVVERAMQLNPHHPGWYHHPAFYYAYHRRDYRGALEIALKINMPGYFYLHAGLAAVYGQLGDQERARAALRTLLALKPDFGTQAREEYGKWLDAELTEHLIEGLRKAGLEIGGADQVATSPSSTSEADVSPLATSDTQPTSSPTQSIAVLPFANISADEENEYFCDGLAEELLNALAKIDELKVAARTSAFSFKGKNAEAREIGKTLNVNTVLEGSVRKAGNRIRINVQLVNAADGYHLWSERYDREMQDIFDVQDEISLSIVNALKVKLLGEEKAAVLKRPT
ncbi:MAG TPA: protein kinase, partial [Blastocatellia bacterium]|nr:protein kinase [Blastocatellia bacterium]